MASNQSTYLPGLSIIRTIAAFSVLFGHMWQFGCWPESNRVFLPEIYLPVTTFFVISGFLIAWGLMREQDKTGDVSIIKAYRRRAKRILPTYYIGIAVGIVALLCLGGGFNGNWALLLCLFPNISQALGSTPFPFWHYWTLGTEIMFYLLFPWVIKYGRKHLLQWTIGIALLWVALKVVTYIVLDKNAIYRLVCLTQFDTIMLGSIGAILFYENTNWLEKICAKTWFAIVAWSLFLTTQLWVPLLPAPIRADVIGVVSFMLILSAFYGHPVLENQVTQYLGNLSYGIYIFHPIVIYTLSTWCVRDAHCANINRGGYLETFAVVAVTIGLSALVNFITDKIRREATR